MKQDRIDRIDSIDKSPAQTKTLMERVEESYIWGSFSDSPVGLIELDMEELRFLTVENTMAISLRTDQNFNQSREIMLRLNSIGRIVQDYTQQFTQQ
ncbi:6bf9f575-a6a5-4185-bff4-6d84b5d9de11 [Thermothielavioides terrestris]|uniref:6bf9f575-a6a5-4185-bff4-6d84b5d9de11 n=1 Tax=Thermothielavioides terrestris TaxID=2587410 RepID=A0A446BKD5_9PEZI|nr:6bf9f575-a6a5-4185-bff4-6d84b5d9de11 [Thermothielavioides terrestris]